MGAGSRTTIAVLAYFGVELFDSTSWYTAAMYGESFPPVTTCVVGTPLGKPQCKLCLSPPSHARSTAGRAKHNLTEIQKEITRVRCAQEEGVMREYVEVRVRPSSLKRLQPLLDA